MRLEVDEPCSKVAAALDENGTIIGLATAGATRDRDAPTPWELYSINVVAGQQGSGLADALLTITAGERDATVWVLADNGRAQSFYSRHGFHLEGATTVHEATGDAQIRMVRHSAER
jgi:ribosomal protein S18 acetylase RimI-like enzyme